MRAIKLAEKNVRGRAHDAAEEIRRFIEQGVASGQLKTGDRLPTERELASNFDTGRNTVRRTLIALEQEGRIDRHVGRGTFIAPAQADAPAAPPLHVMSASQIARTASPLDLMELRLSLEPSVARLCVQRASATEIARMQEIVKASESAPDLQAFEDLDDELHRTIALATRNPLFAAIAAIITAVRNEAEWGGLKKRTLTDQLRTKHRLEHAAIVDAIQRREEDAARAAMEAHLREVKAMMFGG